MKKVLSLFLSVLMLTSVVAAVDLSAYAATVDSGTCGDNLTWKLDSNGTLTISGTGKMHDYLDSDFAGPYPADNPPWSSKSDPIKKVVINNGVTSIGDWAFDYCYSLTSITIPDSVTSIGDCAFGWCTSLTSVTIPNSVTSIGVSAFWMCESLTSITIPKSVTSIGVSAFSVCGKLKSFSVSSSNKYFKSSNGVLFNKNKTKLVCYPAGKSGSYTIPNSVKKIGDAAFEGCENLTSITIPNSVTSIGDAAFSNCESLTSVTIPNSVTSIGEVAFTMCIGLTRITIGNSVTSIGDYAFNYCTSLTNVIIGSGVTSIGDWAFSNCNSIKDVYYTGSQNKWNKISIGNYNSNLTRATIHYNHSHTYKVTKATTDKNGSKKCSVCGAKTIIYKPKTISLSTTSYTYNGKAKKPTVKVKNSAGGTISSKNYTVSYINQSTGKTVSSMKNPGKYYVKVKFKGSSYSGALKTSLKIKPKKTSIKSITASSKGFTVKWGKVSTQNTGYQIQYSTSKSFKSPKTVTIKKTGTTSKKVTKLKAKKKYYVRVRTYKTVKINGKNTKIYSGWSSVKGVTTKK